MMLNSWSNKRIKERRESKVRKKRSEKNKKKEQQKKKRKKERKIEKQKKKMMIRTKWNKIKERLRKSLVFKQKQGKQIILQFDCIQYLNHFKGPMGEFLRQSEEIMKFLETRFSTNKQSYLCWIKFLDIANQMVYLFAQDIDEYRNQLTRIIRYVLLDNGNREINDVDWRILRKICSVNTIIEPTLINAIRQDKLIEGFQEEINKSLNYLVWVQDSFLIEHSRNLLTKLKQQCQDTSNQKDIIDSLKNGRFDKKGESKNKFAFLENTLILGEDGGLFLLLNSLDSKFRASLQEIVGKQYIKEKTETTKNGAAKVILGKGSFGKVRFALNLLYLNKYPGDIVCVKKTNSINKLPSSSLSPEATITTNTLEDYFASEMSDLIYSPKVVDMAIIIESPAAVETIHQKGYLFMEIIPQNTATKIFSESKYQRWEYQKPYLLDMFEKVNKLLANKVAFTDLKPDNTLFNVYNRKASLIDLGGTVKSEDLSNYKGSYQYTPEFSAPEIKDKAKVVNLISTVSYSCGQIVKYLAIKTDCNKKLLDQFASKLMDKRMPLTEAYSELQKIGDDRWKEAVIFANYINRVQQRLLKNKSSISINEDIEDTIKTFIPLSLTHKDPYRFRNLKTVDLFSQIEAFLDEKSSGVFLLLGKAGSGKSVVLQQQFIKQVKTWQSGRPLPIFFNLANNTSLPKIIQLLDTELNTNLKANLKGKQIILFIDSFDEGVNIEKYKQTLVSEYLNELYNQSRDNVKILISCRSDFLKNDSDDNWFKPPTGIFQKYFITPLDYSQSIRWNQYIQSWCKLKHKENKIGVCTQKIGKFKSIIVTGFIFQIFMAVFVAIPENLTNLVTALELYKLYLKYDIISRIQKLNKEQRNFIKQSFIKSNPHTVLQDRIFQVGCYLACKMHINDQFRILNKDSIFSQFQYRTSEPIRIQKMWFILKLLPLKIESKQKFTSKYDYKQEVAVGFIHDTLKNYFILQQIKKELNTGESKILSSRNITDNVELIGFLRDSVQNQKNPALVAQLRQQIEISKTNQSPECVTAAANAITILTAAQICLSGQNFSNISVMGANLKNGVFQYSDFSNANLSGVNLTNVDIVGSKFNGANMASIELSAFPMLLQSQSALITIVFAPDSKSIAMSLQNGAIHIYQFGQGKVTRILKGHQKMCFALIYSKDGSRIVSGSQDGTVKIWDCTSGNILRDLKLGYQVCGVSYSPDEKTLAVGGNSPELKLYESSTGNQLATYKDTQKFNNVIAISYSPGGKEIAFASETVLLHAILILDAFTGRVKFKIEKDSHRMLINWICYSPNGKYLASCSADHSIKIWNADSNYQLIKTINAHSDSVTRISFSPDSQFIASGSFDKTLKIIDVETSTVIKEMSGHRYWITSVCYSPDSRFIVTGGGDLQVRMWDTNISYTTLQDFPANRKKILKIGYRTGSEYIAINFDDNKSLALYSLLTFQFVRYINNNSDFPQLVTISPDLKNVIYSKYGQVWTYNIASDKASKRQCGEQLFLCFSEDCKMGASIYWAGNTKIDFQIWDIEKGKKLHDLRRENEQQLQCKLAAISHDNRLIAIDEANQQLKAQQNIRLFNASEGVLVSTLNFQAEILVLIFNQKSEIICGGRSEERSVLKWWNAQTGELVHRLQNFNRDITSINLLKPSNNIVIGFSNYVISVVDIITNKAQDLFGHNGIIANAYLFSQTQRQIISASGDCTLRLWEQKSFDGEDRWCYSRSIIGSETPLLAALCKMPNVRNLSNNNMKILQQKYAEITNSTGSQIYNGQLIKDGLSKYQQKINSEYQKRLPIKQVQYIFNREYPEESKPIRKNPQASLQVQLLKKSSSKTQQANTYSSQAYESQTKDECCCQVYKVELIYDNPLLNIRNGLKKASQLLGVTLLQVYQRTSQDLSTAELLSMIVD